MEVAISLTKVRDIIVPKDRFQATSYISKNPTLARKEYPQNIGDVEFEKNSTHSSQLLQQQQRQIGDRSYTRGKGRKCPSSKAFRSGINVPCTTHITVDKANHQTTVVGRADGSIIVYRTQFLNREETVTWILHDHHGAILSLAYADDLCEPNGLLFSASIDGTIKVWDLFSRHEGTLSNEKISKAEAANISDTSLSFKSFGSKVGQGSGFSPICIQTLVAHDGAILSIAYASGQLISSSTDGRIIVWENRLGRAMLQYPWLVPVQAIRVSEISIGSQPKISQNNVLNARHHARTQLSSYASSVSIMSRADRPVFFVGDSLGRITTFAARPCIVPIRDASQSDSFSKSAGTIVGQRQTRSKISQVAATVLSKMAFSGVNASRLPTLASRPIPGSQTRADGEDEDDVDAASPRADRDNYEESLQQRNNRKNATLPTGEGQLSDRVRETMKERLERRLQGKANDSDPPSAVSKGYEASDLLQMALEQQHKTLDLLSNGENKVKPTSDPTPSLKSMYTTKEKNNRVAESSKLKSVAVIVKYKPISTRAKPVHKLSVTSLLLAGREQVCISLSYDGSARGHDARTGLPVFYTHIHSANGTMTAQLPMFTTADENSASSDATSRNQSLSPTQRHGLTYRDSNNTQSGLGKSQSSSKPSLQPQSQSGLMREELNLSARFTAAAWAGADNVHLLLLGDSKGQLHVYSLADGICLKVFLVSQTSQPVVSISVRPGGRIVVTTPSDCCEWQISRLRSAVECLGHRDRVISLAISGGGGRDTLPPSLLAASKKTPAPSDLPSSLSSVTSVYDVFGAGDLYSASLDGEIRFWDLFERSCLASLVERESETMCMIHLPFTVALATGHEDGSLKLSNSETATSLKLLHHKNSLTTLSYVFDWGIKDQASYIVTGSYDSTLAFWPAAPRSHRYTPHPEFCIMASKDEVLCSAATLQLLICAYGGSSAVLDMLTKNSAALVTIQQQVYKYEEDSKKKQQEARQIEMSKGLTTSISVAAKERHGITVRPEFLGDALLVASSGNELVVRVWCAHSKSLVSELWGHTEAVTAIVFDGHILLSGSEDCTVRAWCSLTGKQLAFHSEHSLPITAITVFPGSGLVASCSLDGSVILWSYVTGKIARRLAQRRPLYSIAFSRATRQLLVGCDDGPILVFDVADQLLAEKTSYEIPIQSKDDLHQHSNPHDSGLADNFTYSKIASRSKSHHQSNNQYCRQDLAVQPPPTDISVLDNDLRKWEERLAVLKENTARLKQTGDELRKSVAV